MTNHYLSFRSLPRHKLSELLDRAHYFSQIQKPDSLEKILKHKTVANVFYEASTRTRCSFEIATKKLGCHVINFIPEYSSSKKGETVYDTLKTLESLGVDAIIIRHSDDSIIEDLSSQFKFSLINAGAGKSEHPSQGLLDLLTLQQEFKNFDNIKIAVSGDIKHSRVAGSLIAALDFYPFELFLTGPSELLPKVNHPRLHYAQLDEVISDVDALMMLRVQFERHEGIDLNAQTYLKDYGLNQNRLKMLKPKAIIMHPGPFNRGIEICNEAIEHSQSRIFKQMSNGVFARMSILEWALGGQL